jgi:hypothetical protein
MRALSLAAILALAAIPAAAQQSGTSATGQTGAQPQTQAQPGQQQTPQFTAMSKEKLRKTLEEAGFQQIQIVDATYTVRARTAEGNEVVMFIDPPSTTAGAMGTAGTTGSTTSGSGATKSK